MNYLIDPLLELKEYVEVLERTKKDILPATVTGPSDSQKVHICYALCSHSNRKGIFVTFNEMQARRMYEDFSFFYGDGVLFYPTKEVMLHDVEAKSYDAVFNRLKVIDRIARGDYKFVVTSAEALIQKLIPLEDYTKNVIHIKAGDTIDVDKLYARLTAMGYERCTTVEGKGQFAVRGGIIDIFGINMENAVRIELFGDEVDSVRSFDVISQRSVESLDNIRIIPSKEILYDENRKHSVIDSIRADLLAFSNKPRVDRDLLNTLKSNINNDIERFRSDHYFPGIDRYIPYIIHSPVSLLDYVKQDNPIVFADEANRIQSRIENMELEIQESCKSLLEKGKLLPESFDIYINNEDIQKEFNNTSTLFLNTLPSDSNIKQRATYTIASKSLTSYQGNTNLLAEDLQYWKGKQYRVVVLAGLRGRGQRLSEEINSKDVSSVYIDELDNKLTKGLIVVTKGSLHKGFEYPDIGLAIVGDKEIYGQGRKSSKKAKKSSSKSLQYISYPTDSI